MTSPTSSIVVPGSARYGSLFRPNDDRTALVANGQQPIPIGPTEPPSNEGLLLDVSSARSRSYLAPTDTSSRAQLVFGTYRPTKATTGLDPARATVDDLVEYTGSYTFPNATYPNGTASSPTIVEKLWFTRKVSLSGARYIKFRDCHFSGPWDINETPIQGTNLGNLGNSVEDSIIWPQNPQSDSPFYKGWQCAFRRVYVRNCSDGYAHIGGGWNADRTALSSSGDYSDVDQGIEVQGCLIEKCTYLSPDYGAAGKLPDNASHLDTTGQIRGGKGIVFRGNAGYGFVDPAVGEGGKASVDMLSGTHLTGKRDQGLWTLSHFMCSPKLGNITGMLVEQNWLDGADYMFVIAEHVAPGITVRDNRFGRDHQSSITRSPGTNPDVYIDGFGETATYTASATGLVLVKLEAQIVITGNRYWYELGPALQKWPYNRQPQADQGETAPPADVIARWDAAGILPNNEATWPQANTRSRG